MVWITHETIASPRIIQQLRREDSIKTELYFNGAALLSNHVTECYTSIPGSFSTRVIKSAPISQMLSVSFLRRICPRN